MNLRIAAVFLLFILIAFGSGIILVASMPGTGSTTGSSEGFAGIFDVLHEIFAERLSWLSSHGTILAAVSTDSRINGTVVDASTLLPIGNATVVANGNHTLTDENGHYEIEVAAGNYTVMASNAGYQNQSRSVTVAINQTVTVNFNLSRVVQMMGWIEGTVTDANTTSPIQGANVTADGHSMITNSTGGYKLQVQAPFSYNVTAAKKGYISKIVANVTIYPEQVVTLDFKLSPVAPPLGMGILRGKVTDADTGKPLSGAMVTANGKSESTNDSGQYEMILTAGVYNVTAAKSGYVNQTTTGIVITENMTTIKNFALVPVAPRPIQVMVEIHPEALNLRSNGRWVTVSIELPAGFDAKDISISSIRLNGSIGVDMSGQVEVFRQNGISELTFKVSREAVEDLIMGSDDHLGRFGEATFVLTGKLSDKTPFRGIVTIKTIRNQLQVLR